MNEILVFIGKIIMIPALIIANLFAPIPLINDVVYPPTEDIPVGAALPQATGVFETSLAAPISSTATSMTLTANAVRGGGVVAGYTCFTVDEGSAQAEIICGTVSTTSVTSMTRGISYSDGVTEVTANKFAHRRGANVKITDFPILQILKAQNNGDATFDAPISYKTGIGPIANSDLADKEYVVSIATGGTITTDKVIEAGTAGETVAAGNLVYYKTSDSRWWKSDADLIATVENIVLGIAQGSGTVGTSISGGVLLRGIDTNQTGLTANTVYYASNTAGALSSSAGTISVTIGFAPSTTTISFNPRFDKTGRASETADGTVEEATDAEVTAGTATGATGAKLFVTPAKLATNLGTTVADTTAIKSGLQQTVGAGSNATVKLYYNVHALFTLWTGGVLNDTVTTFANWFRTDSTKVAIPPLGNMASFASTADAELYLTSSLYSSGSTLLDFSDNNIVIMDWWAKYISGAGENMMGIGLAGEFSTINTDNNTLAIFNIRNGVLFSHTSKTATKSSNNISSGLTLTNWNNYRIEFDMGADTVTFYVNGVLKATHTGASIPTSSTVAFGFGRDTTNPVLFNVTAPNLSLEMNP